MKGTRSRSTEWQSQGQERWMVCQAVFFHTDMLPLLYQPPKLGPELKSEDKLEVKRDKLMLCLLPQCLRVNMSSRKPSLPAKQNLEEMG